MGQMLLLTVQPTLTTTAVSLLPLCLFGLIPPVSSTVLYRLLHSAERPCIPPPAYAIFRDRHIAY